MQSIDINWPIFKGHAIVSIGRQKTNLQKIAFYVICNKHDMKDSRMSRKILLIDIKHENLSIFPENISKIFRY